MGKPAYDGDESGDKANARGYAPIVVFAVQPGNTSVWRYAISEFPSLESDTLC